MEMHRVEGMFWHTYYWKDVCTHSGKITYDHVRGNDTYCNSMCFLMRSGLTCENYVGKETLIRRIKRLFGWKN